MRSERQVRFAAVGDLHCKKDSIGAFREMFARASEVADALLLCGDLTDYGLPEEARVLADELAAAKVPVVAVLGNHDFESDAQDEVRRILCDAGVQMLDGEACEIHGVGIAGAKGFAGGYGRATLGSWGERPIKSFVNEAIQEALKLESALAKLRTAERVALLHYSPIAATVQGEPIEIFPFLGTSRLEEPLIRFPVSAVLHGHAHRGSPQGKTVNGTPVYNVAMPLLKRIAPERPPFRLIEFPNAGASADEVHAGASHQGA
ncbi:MAG TPA: metallophosphoesterase [Casimicrobiaceae bacterium]|jgi:Icc-related predicted phosphoesterase|nr:metallophosphoesterase [Casimicrobiaceae bacterium]